MNRKVVWAKFQTDIFISEAYGGPGIIGAVLPPVNKTIPNLEMEHTPEGLLIKARSSTSLVPWANVILAILAPEPKPAAKAVA